MWSGIRFRVLSLTWVGLAFLTASAVAAPAPPVLVPLAMQVHRPADLSFHPSGQLLAVGSTGPLIAVWDVAQGMPWQILCPEVKQARYVAFSPDGQTLAFDGPHVVTGDSPIALWDLRSRRVRQMLGARGGGFADLAYSPDGGTLAALGGTKPPPTLDPPRTLAQARTAGITIWDTASWTERLFTVHDKIRLFATPEASLPLRREPEEVGWLHPYVAFTPGGTLVCGARARPPGPVHTTYLLLLDTTTGRILQRVPIGETDGRAPDLYSISAGLTVPPSSLDYSPTGGAVAGILGQTLHVWSSGSWARQTVNLSGPAFGPRFSPDGRVLAHGGTSVITLRDVETGRPLRILRGHAGVVPTPADPAPPAVMTFPPDLRYSRDGRLLASSGMDGTTRLWNPEAGTEVAALLTFGTGEDYLAATPQGYYRGTLEAGTRAAWQIGKHLFPVDAFEARFRRSDLVQHSLQTREPIPDAPLLPGDRTPPLLALDVPDAQPPEKDTRSNTPLVAGETLRVRLRVFPGAPTSSIHKLGLRVNGRWAGERRLREVKVHAAGEGTVAEKAEILGARRPVEAVAPSTAEGAPKRWMVVDATLALLPNERELRLVSSAWDEEEVRGDTPLVVLQRKDPPSPGAVSLYVLAIGRGDAEAGPRFAEADARDLAALLKEQQGKTFTKVETRVLAGAEATPKAVEAELRWLKETPLPEDLAVVLVSGRATITAKGKRLLRLAPPETTEEQPQGAGAPPAGDPQQGMGAVDAPGGDPQDGEKAKDEAPSRDLEWGKLVKALAACKARQVVLFLDCCRPGQPEEGQPAPDDLADDLLKEAGVSVVAANRWNEVSLEDDAAGHGVFTAALLEGLRGQAAAKDQTHIALVDLGRHVAAVVPRLTRGRQHPWVVRGVWFDGWTPLAAAPEAAVPPKAQ